jgi:hypothetical protein
VAEAAGAASTAAFLQNPSAYAGQNVVLLMTGANIPLEVIRRRDLTGRIGAGGPVDMARTASIPHSFSDTVDECHRPDERGQQPHAVGQIAIPSCSSENAR